MGDSDEGRLKVSFSGPFTAATTCWRRTMKLSLVSSYNLQYLWILSRTPHPQRR